jgi:hypothetical protein
LPKKKNNRGRERMLTGQKRKEKKKCTNAMYQETEKRINAFTILFNTRQWGSTRPVKKRRIGGSNQWHRVIVVTSLVFFLFC